MERHESSRAEQLKKSRGPNLLANYLRAYVQSRQMSDTERPWGLGDDSLDAFWMELNQSVAGDPKRVNSIVVDEIGQDAREHIVETIAPLMFALPLRTFPAELRATKSGDRLQFTLRHADGPGRETVEHVGYLPSGLTTTFIGFIERVLRFQPGERRRESVISAGGRRRQVHVTLLPKDRGVAIRFLSRLHSPACEE